MPRKSTNPPDEAAWYATPAGRCQTRREFERALKRGTTIRSDGSAIPLTDPALLAELAAEAKATKAISIRAGLKRVS
jgi:hypothetical protein